MSVKQWEAFFVPLCRHSKPKKNKLIIIAYLSPSPHGFFINSKINNFIKKQPALLPCEAQILVSQHNFLEYDSFVDCHEIFSFDSSELTRSRGIISVDAQQAILDAVDACSVLEEIHKIRIKECKEDRTTD